MQQPVSVERGVGAIRYVRWFVCVDISEVLSLFEVGVSVHVNFVFEVGKSVLAIVDPGLLAGQPSVNFAIGHRGRTRL